MVRRLPLRASIREDTLGISTCQDCGLMVWHHPVERRSSLVRKRPSKTFCVSVSQGFPGCTRRAVRSRDPSFPSARLHQAASLDSYRRWSAPARFRATSWLEQDGFSRTARPSGERAIPLCHGLRGAVGLDRITAAEAYRFERPRPSTGEPRATHASIVFGSTPCCRASSARVTVFGSFGIALLGGGDGVRG